MPRPDCDDTIYCPVCDHPLKVSEDEPDLSQGWENWLVTAECPLCGWAAADTGSTYCAAWDRVERKLDNRRMLAVCRSCEEP